MSRIPKIGFGMPSGGKENKLDMATKKICSTKRPSDDHSAVEKRPRLVNNPPAKNKLQPSNFQEKKLATAQKSKLAASQTGFVRASMPAVTSSTRIRIPGKPSRPLWDIKGRLQDMEENFVASQTHTSKLTQELEAYNERIAVLERANTLLHKDVEIKSVQSEEATSQIQKLELQLKEKTQECQCLDQDLRSCRADYEHLRNCYREEVRVLKSSIASLTSMKSAIQSQLEAAELSVESQRREIESLSQQISVKDSKIETLSREICDMDSKLREGESMRRQLHNTIQELKGNIRVFCRLRPPLAEEEKGGMDLASIVAVSDKTIQVQQLPDVGHNESGGKASQKYEFSFDCFFSPSTSQEQIFSEISQLVQSALDGYNVCIFAYGQTGSGKTYTMEGPADIVDFIANRENPELGMIPRSVHQIFSSISALEPKGWKYTVHTLFLEIYNERIQDLLNTQGENAKCDIVKSGAKGKDCIISNVTAMEVTSEEQVYELMKKARINRAVAATKCNEHSSRSHFVFQMKIRGENSVTTEKCDATLSLVDLAGSERVKETESEGDRLTEAKAINKSLSSLGKVIMSLSKKENHIPYRDSKLTHLLSNSLGGNSKTLMFVNCSPINKHLSETINSLRFATKVNNCVIGTAQKRLK